MLSWGRADRRHPDARPRRASRPGARLMRDLARGSCVDDGHGAQMCIRASKLCGAGACRSWGRKHKNPPRRGGLGGLHWGCSGHAAISSSTTLAANGDDGNTGTAQVKPISCGRLSQHHAALLLIAVSIAPISALIALMTMSCCVRPVRAAWILSAVRSCGSTHIDTLTLPFRLSCCSAIKTAARGLFGFSRQRKRRPFAR